MKPIEHFQFCPRCGRPQTPTGRQDAFECRECGFLYHFNPAIAAAALIVNPEGEILFIQRAKEPAKGKLSFPGGFIDAGETAEDAVRREVREELGLALADLKYLCSGPNDYVYREVTYSVLDQFYVGRPEAVAVVSARDEVQSYCWLEPRRVGPGELAFASHHQALAAYLGKIPA